MSHPARGLEVVRGRILAYRLFDVGDAIDLERAERESSVAPASQRARLAREGSAALAIAVPPLALTLGSRRLALAAGPSGLPGRDGLAVECAARLFDFGVASIRYEIEIPAGTPLLDLLPLLDQLYDSPEPTRAAREELDRLLPRLAGAVADPHSWEQAEDYTVIHVEELKGRPSAGEVLEHGVIARLLLGEAAENLSRSERDDVLRHAVSYLDDDLAVIGWNSAFVLEPSGSRDIPDLLEFATSQLLEMRYYDAVLDAELPRIHKEVARARQSPLAVLWSPYGRLSRRVFTRYLELVEFTERADNALKVVGDFYLARVYQAAVDRFRIASWRDSVLRKQELLARIYALLSGEVAAHRSTLLEATIVALIVFEIALALLGGSR